MGLKRPLGDRNIVRYMYERDHHNGLWWSHCLHCTSSQTLCKIKGSAIFISEMDKKWTIPETLDRTLIGNGLFFCSGKGNNLCSFTQKVNV